MAIEFCVEDSLPRSQIKFSGGDGHDYFVMDQQRLQVRITVVLASLVVLVVLAERSQVLQPLIDVFDQAALIVVYVHARRDVHRRDQHHAFFHSTLAHDFFHLRRQVDIGSMRLGMKLQVFGKGFHGGLRNNGNSI